MARKEELVDKISRRNRITELLKTNGRTTKDPEFVIKKGIPIPARKRGGGAETSALSRTLVKMAVGDCIDIPYSAQKRPNIIQIASRYGIRVRICEMTEDGQKFWRVWKRKILELEEIKSWHLRR